MPLQVPVWQPTPKLCFYLCACQLAVLALERNAWQCRGYVNKHNTSDTWLCACLPTASACPAQVPCSRPLTHQRSMGDAGGSEGPAAKQPARLPSVCGGGEAVDEGACEWQNLAGPGLGRDPMKVSQGCWLRMRRQRGWLLAQVCQLPGRGQWPPSGKSRDRHHQYATGHKRHGATSQ